MRNISIAYESYAHSRPNSRGMSATASSGRRGDSLDEHFPPLPLFRSRTEYYLESNATRNISNTEGSLDTLTPESDLVVP
jgi:hypothetical protein